MWLKELVFQGLFGVTRPARLTVDPGFCVVGLPEGADPVDFQTLLLSLLYPRLVPATDLLELGDGDGRRSRIGAVFSVPGVAGRVHKVYRTPDPESIVLQEVPEGGRGREIARGVDAVSKVLARVHGVPSSPDEFMLLHCAEFGDYLAGGVATGNPAVDDLITRYREAVQIERLENEIVDVESRLADLDRDLKKLGKRDKKVADLEARVAVIDKVLTDGGADLEIVRGYDAASKELEARLHGYQDQIVQARANQDAIRPRPIWKEYLLVAGAVIAIAATITSLATDIRPIALINLGAFTIAGWALLRRFGVLEQSTGYMTRVEQVYRHVEVAQEERGTLEREFKAALGRLELESALDLDHLEDEKDTLKVRLQSLAGKQDPEKTRRLLKDLGTEEAELTAEIDRLREERSHFGDYTVAPYELERQLEAAGISVAALRGDSEEDAKGLFARFAEYAAARRQLRDGRLTDKTAAMAGRFAKHLLGDGFAKVDLGETGTLRLGQREPEAVDAWLERGNNEVKLLSLAIVGALIATSPAALVGASRLIVLVHPYAGLKDGQRRRVQKLFDYLGKYMQVVVLDASA